MNLVAIESPIGLDRLATRDEIRCAMLISLQCHFGFAGACDDFVPLATESGECPPRKESMLEKIYSQSDHDAGVREAVAGVRADEAKFIAESIQSKGIDFAEWLSKHIVQLDAAAKGS